MQLISKTAKIFKYISECIFHRTQLMAMHNTIMTSNTNGVPPSETHMQTSFTQCRTTVSQCKYCGNSASENMTVHIPFTIQGTNRNNFNTITNTMFQVISYRLSTLTQQVPNLCKSADTQFLFGDACFIWIVSALQLIWSSVQSMQCIYYNTLKYASYCT